MMIVELVRLLQGLIPGMFKIMSLIVPHIAIHRQSGFPTVVTPVISLELQAFAIKALSQSFTKCAFIFMQFQRYPTTTARGNKYISWHKCDLS